MAVIAIIVAVPAVRVVFISVISAANATDIPVNEVEKVVCIKRQLAIMPALSTAI